VAGRKPRASHRVGVVERGMFTPGFSEELERPDDFHVNRRGGEAAEPSSRPDEWSRTGPAAGGSKLESGYENKTVRRGTGARPRRTAFLEEHQESELLSSTYDGGELIAGGPTRGKREAGSWDRDGKHEQVFDLEHVSTKLKRIAELAVGLKARSESMIRRAGCGKSARPDLQGGRGR